MLLGGTRFGRTLTVGANKVWVDYDEAIGEDPRIYLRSLSGLLQFSGGPNCAFEPSDIGDGTTAAGWRSVGADSVAGRPAHHLACGGGDLWLDDETRLILRVRQPVSDDTGNPIPGSVTTTEVTHIEFGDQPAALFASHRQTASLPCRWGRTTRSVGPGKIPWRSSTIRLVLERRRRPMPHPRQSQRQARRPAPPRARATARFRHATRVSRPARWPGPRRA
jgi:hypothetical protein